MLSEQPSAVVIWGAVCVSLIVTERRQRLYDLPLYVVDHVPRPLFWRVPQDRQELGKWGEWMALRHLRGLGWDILARNWRSGRGEIDLIAYHKKELVLVEVKTRRGNPNQPLPETNVGSRKVRKLEQLAHDFTVRYEIQPCPWRFDVIAIQTVDFREYELFHFSL